jgi:hypothetical protein
VQWPFAENTSSLQAGAVFSAYSIDEVNRGEYNAIPYPSIALAKEIPGADRF